MLIAIISVSLAIVVFLCFLLAFKIGLRLGMISSKGQVPPPVKTPVQAVEDWWTAKGDKKKEKEVQEGFNSIFSYNGDIPPKEE